jgi:hypothetical protein
VTGPAEPRLRFLPEAWRKMRLWTDLCTYEISGLGLVDEDGSDFVLTDLRLVEQEVTPLATALDGAAVSNLIVDLLDANEDVDRLRLWWHSHARETCFWSGEDERTISTFQNDYMISIVTNQAGRFLARLDRYEPRTTEWVWVDPPTEAIEPTAEEIAEVRAQIAALVRRSA